MGSLPLHGAMRGMMHSMLVVAGIWTLAGCGHESTDSTDDRKLASARRLDSARRRELARLGHVAVASPHDIRIANLDGSQPRDWPALLGILPRLEGFTDWELVGFRPDGEWLLCRQRAGNEILVLDCGGAAVIGKLAGTEFHRGEHWSPTGAQILVLRRFRPDQDSLEVAIWEPAKSRAGVRFRFLPLAGPQGFKPPLLWGAKGDSVFAIHSRQFGPEVRATCLATGQSRLVLARRGGGSIDAMAWNRDRTVLAIASSDSLWIFREFGQIDFSIGGGQPTHEIRWSPGGMRLLVVKPNGDIVIVSLDGTEPRLVPRPSQPYLIPGPTTWLDDDTYVDVQLTSQGSVVQLIDARSTPEAPKTILRGYRVSIGSVGSLPGTGGFVYFLGTIAGPWRRWKGSESVGQRFRPIRADIFYFDARRFTSFRITRGGAFRGIEEERKGSLVESLWWVRDQPKSSL